MLSSESMWRNDSLITHNTLYSRYFSKLTFNLLFLFFLNLHFLLLFLFLFSFLFEISEEIINLILSFFMLLFNLSLLFSYFYIPDQSLERFAFQNSLAMVICQLLFYHKSLLFTFISFKFSLMLYSPVYGDPPSEHFAFDNKLSMSGNLLFLELKGHCYITQGMKSCRFGFLVGSLDDLIEYHRKLVEFEIVHLTFGKFKFCLHLLLVYFQLAFEVLLYLKLPLSFLLFLKLLFVPFEILLNLLDLHLRFQSLLINFLFCLSDFLELLIMILIVLLFRHFVVPMLLM